MLVIYLLLCFFIILLFNSTIKHLNLPPGPRWLPIVGNLLLVKQLVRKLGGSHKAFLELANKFDTDILTLKMGNNIVIVVSSYSVIKEVLTCGKFDSRPDDFFARLRCFGVKRGLTSAEGILWKEQRDFTVRHLKMLGFGREGMKDRIKEELKEILNAIQQNLKRMRMQNVLIYAVNNVLWSIIVGNRLSKENPRFNKLLDLLSKRSKAFDILGGILNQHPWLRFIAPEITGYNLINSINNELKGFFMKIIDDHHATWTAGRNDDLIYTFISEMYKPESDPTMFNNDQLLMVCVDFFIAGLFTTSSTIDFALLTMLLYPNIQSKVHNVIDSHYNIYGKLDYSDRSKVPYLEAVIAESERYTAVVPIMGPRRPVEDTTLRGYHIPKNSTILINTYSHNVVKNVWGDPEVFRPERFLDAKGDFISNNIISPFGLGKRKCIGESLARQCIFQFFTEILRNYTVKPAEGLPLPTLQVNLGITLSPKEYYAEFIPRQIP